MQVGDFVKLRYWREVQTVGVTLIEGANAWWTILWTDGKREIVSERNLKVISASR